MSCSHNCIKYRIFYLFECKNWRSICRDSYSFCLLHPTRLAQGVEMRVHTRNSTYSLMLVTLYACGLLWCWTFPAKPSISVGQTQLIGMFSKVWKRVTSPSRFINLGGLGVSCSYSRTMTGQQAGPTTGPFGSEMGGRQELEPGGCLQGSHSSSSNWAHSSRYSLPICQRKSWH